MIKFPSVEQFRNVIHNVRKDSEYHNVAYPTLTFVGTVKSHGTNAGISFNYKERKFTFQSRERELSLTSDNAGFFVWANHPDRMETWMDIVESYNHCDYDNCTIFMEFCGGNIQKGVAINGLPKMGLIFNILLSNSDEDRVWVGIDVLDNLHFGELDIYSIKTFGTYEVEVDFNKPEVAQNILVELTTKVGDECPIGKYFGNIGTGEGIVYKLDVGQDFHSKYNNSGYWFKVKDERHSLKSHVKTLVPVDTELVESINEFVDEYVSENRCKQGLDKLREMGLEATEASTGDFIRWIMQDIFKEESDTILASGFTTKQLNGPIAKKAKVWYIANMGN